MLQICCSKEAIKNSENPNMMIANPSEMEREVFAAVTTKVGVRNRLLSTEEKILAVIYTTTLEKPEKLQA